MEARGALLLGRQRRGPAGMTAREVLDMATRGGAGCLGRDGEIGQLTVGAAGDLVCWPQEGLAFAGALTDPVEAWLRCGPTAARHTVVAGRVLVRDGALTVPGAPATCSPGTRPPPPASSTCPADRAAYSYGATLTIDSICQPATPISANDNHREIAVSRQQLHITLAGREHVVDAGTTASDALRNGTAGEPPASTVIAARINGELRDLATPLADGDEVAGVEIASDDGRAILRHSTAHVMAQAVQELFPEAKLGIGPPVEAGFYYDFDVEHPFGPGDLKAIEGRMRAIVKQGQPFSRRVVSEAEARTELAKEPYKLELVGLKGGARREGAPPSEVSVEESVEVGGPELTIYDNLDPKIGAVCWSDLCRGPHLPTTRDIPAFKLMRTGGAYWRGSEKNPQLQRIYGTAWESRQAQDDYLHLLEEAERRDHRKLGAELDLFSFPTEIGSGLAVFHPKGGTIRRVMEEYSRQRHRGAATSS